MWFDLGREEVDVGCRKCGADLYDELRRVLQHCVDVGVMPSLAGVRCLDCEQQMDFRLTWKTVLSWAQPVE